MPDPLPWEVRRPVPKTPGLSVDLRRCIGCHACSIACKTAHELPLGEFHMRVRWLPRPDRASLAFVPLFSEACDLGSAVSAQGLEPECVRACPTDALIFGDRDDPKDALPRFEKAQKTVPFPGPAKTNPGVSYAAFEPWIAEAVGQGVPLDPSDPDPIYEQGPAKGGGQ